MHEPARHGQLRVPGQLPLVRAVPALPGGLADRRPRRPTTRSTTRCRATSPTRRSRASTRASRSDVLYVTNGESTDYAHRRDGTLAWTPELEEGCTGCGFVFPDDEALVQAEFEKVLPFAQDVVASAADPANPGLPPRDPRRSRSTWRATTRSRRALPLANFKFAVSYGDPQTVRVLALARPRQGRRSSTASTAAR